MTLRKYGAEKYIYEMKEHMMRKIFFTIFIIAMLVMTGCSFPFIKDDGKVLDIEKREENDKQDLTLQLAKIDEELGHTLDDEYYKELQFIIDEDPQLGDINDISFLPIDIIEYEDGSMAILFLFVNRLSEAIESIEMKFTFGNDDGEYIFEDSVVRLAKENMGIVDVDHVVPIYFDIKGTEEEIDIFMGLTDENVYMSVDSVNIEFE